MGDETMADKKLTENTPKKEYKKRLILYHCFFGVRTCACIFMEGWRDKYIS